MAKFILHLELDEFDVEYYADCMRLKMIEAIQGEMRFHVELDKAKKAGDQEKIDLYQGLVDQSPTSRQYHEDMTKKFNSGFKKVGD